MNKEDKIKYWMSKVTEDWRTFGQVPLGLLLGGDEVLVAGTCQDLRVLGLLADMKYADRIFDLHREWLVPLIRAHVAEIDAETAEKLVRLDRDLLPLFEILHSGDDVRKMIDTHFSATRPSRLWTDPSRLGTDPFCLDTNPQTLQIARERCLFILRCLPTERVVGTFREMVIADPEYLELLLPDRMFTVHFGEVPETVRQDDRERGRIADAVFDRETAVRTAEKLTSFRYLNAMPSVVVDVDLCRQILVNRLTMGMCDEDYHVPAHLAIPDVALRLVRDDPRLHRALPTSMFSVAVFEYLAEIVAREGSRLLLARLPSVTLTFAEKMRITDLIRARGLDRVEDLVGGVLSGHTFNQLTPGKSLVKLTCQSEIQDRKQITDGEVRMGGMRLDSKFGAGLGFFGLEFVEASRIGEYYKDPTHCVWSRSVTVPDDAIVLVRRNGFTASSLVFGPRTPVPEGLVRKVISTPEEEWASLMSGRTEWIGEEFPAGSPEPGSDECPASGPVGCPASGPVGCPASGPARCPAL